MATKARSDTNYMSLAGLPRHVNARMENIHFLCCSECVCPLDMSKPISEDLVKLEHKGVIVYDALYKEMVLVIAPLMCIICDNPRASELFEPSWQFRFEVLLRLYG